jgi:hypothetical protein
MKHSKTLQIGTRRRKVLISRPRLEEEKKKVEVEARREDEEEENKSLRVFG